MHIFYVHILYPRFLCHLSPLKKNLSAILGAHHPLRWGYRCWRGTTVPATEPAGGGSCGCLWWTRTEDWSRQAKVKKVAWMNWMNLFYFYLCFGIFFLLGDSKGPFSSPGWRSLNPWKGHVFTIPKKGHKEWPGVFFWGGGEGVGNQEFWGKWCINLKLGKSANWRIGKRGALGCKTLAGGFNFFGQFFRKYAVFELEYLPYCQGIVGCTPTNVPLWEIPI